MQHQCRERRRRSFGEHRQPRITTPGPEQSPTMAIDNLRDHVIEALNRGPHHVTLRVPQRGGIGHLNRHERDHPARQ